MPLNQIDAFMAAISSQESGGNYNARNPSSGASGRFQIMPANWAPWSRETFGRVVSRSPRNQDRVARHKMTQYYRNYGSWDLVAAAWFGGPGAASELKRGNRSVLSRSDGNMNIGQYIAKMKNGMSQNMSRTPSMYDPSNDRTVPSGASVPSGPSRYDGNMWANYDNVFGGVGAAPQGAPTQENDELSSDNIGDALIASFEAMGRAMSPDGTTQDIDEITDIYDGEDDEDAEDFDPGERGPKSIEQSIGSIEDVVPETLNEVVTGKDEPEWWNPTDPLMTPFDAYSTSSRMAFETLGQQEALSLLGDLGVPSGAQADYIPARKLSSPKQAPNPGLEAVQIGKKYLGIPYLWGGTDPRRGLDCSGFLQLVYRQLGVNLPRVSRDQATVGKRVKSMSQARPGDLLAFSSARVGGAIGHIGIYVGDGKIMHAPRTGKNVEIVPMYRTPTTIRRVL